MIDTSLARGLLSEDITRLFEGMSFNDALAESLRLNSMGARVNIYPISMLGTTDFKAYTLRRDLPALERATRTYCEC